MQLFSGSVSHRSVNDHVMVSVMVNVRANARVSCILSA